MTDATMLDPNSVIFGFIGGACVFGLAGFLIGELVGAMLMDFSSR